MNKDVRTVGLPDEAVPLDSIEPFHFANHSASFQKDNCTLGIHACYGMEVRQECWRRGGLRRKRLSYFFGPACPRRLILSPVGVVALEQAECCPSTQTLKFRK